MAILLSNALVFASVSTSALSAPLMRNGEPTDVVRTNVPNNNQSPLPPGTAAGIKQAQGYEVSPPSPLVLWPVFSSSAFC